MSEGRPELSNGPDPGSDLQELVRHAQMEPPNGKDDLVRRVQAGDRLALDQLIDANLPVVVKIAGRFRHRGLSDRDLIAEGTMGLIRAARHLVMLPGSRFIEVAAWWIQRAIQTAIIEQASAPDFPRPCGCVQLDQGDKAEHGPASAT